MEKLTTLHSTHSAMGARLVPFGGWEMPLHYGSQIDEHHAVRNDAGMFDVSHMTTVDITGKEAAAYLRRLLANDIAKLQQKGKALYSCMLKENGGVIDDLIVYYLDHDRYRLVVNAATTEKDIDWLVKQSAEFDIDINSRSDLDMIAVQGPNARDKVLPLLPADCGNAADLKPFQALIDASWFVARTGYTGEDGFEIMLPKRDVIGFWKALDEAGVRPCGLGARDTLRLEAGMNLYGTDMDEQTHPLESGLGWTVAWEPAERDFIGRKALEAAKAGGHIRRFVALVLEGKGVLRNDLKLFSGDKEAGTITSGGFSPTLKRSIAMARIDHDVCTDLQVEIRGRRLPVQLVKPPFVRNGKALIDL